MPVLWNSTIALACCLAALALVRAQEQRLPRLVEQAPYDVLTLDKSNDSKVLRVFPVNLPGRKLPEKPKPTDKLKVKLLDDGIEYEVSWQHVARLEPGPSADRRAIAARLQSLNPTVSRASWETYDRYLKSQGVREGIQSYSRVVQLLLGSKMGSGLINDSAIERTQKPPGRPGR